jgi:hypothetical protein
MQLVATDRLSTKTIRDTVHRLEPYFAPISLPRGIYSRITSHSEPEEFDRLESLNEFKHMTKPLTWPQGNGPVDNAVKQPSD